MSTVTAEQNRPIRPEIRNLLGGLQQRIRRYLLIQGFASALVLLGAFFWLSLSLDWLYFQINHLELPRWFRAGIVVAFLGIVAMIFTMWSMTRLLRRFRLKALALVLEKRFPELNDRLLTAVELSKSDSVQESSLTRAMRDRTIDDVIKMTTRLDLDQVFEHTPLRRVIAMAALIVASIGGLAFANQDAIGRWRDGYISLKDEYWHRENGLTVKIVAQPGDRIRGFVDGRYLHPRGGDLSLLIDVPPDKIPPDRVRVDYRFVSSGAYGRANCARIGDREFRHSFGTLSEEIELWITGGDFTNREPYKVVVVSPPQIDQVVLDCEYPKYMSELVESGGGAQFRDQITVLGSQVSLPAETKFVLRAQLNKPLVSARLVTNHFELQIGSVTAWSEDTVSGQLTGESRRDTAAANSAVLILRSTEENSLLSDERRDLGITSYLSSDGQSLSIPFVLSHGLSENSTQRIEESVSPHGPMLQLKPDSLLRIYLEDIDEIISLEPARLTINGIADQAPTIDTQLTGIGSSITRKAVIPVAGTVTDDYGLKEVGFEFTVNDAESWQMAEFGSPPRGYPREFKLQRSAEWQFERFAVLPLELTVGQKLTLAVVAEDGDVINGPHRARGQRYSFQIVSDEELLSYLHRKELNLRQQVEQIIAELNETRADLILHRKRSEERLALLEGTQSDENDELIRQADAAISACAERSLHALRKNANETTAVKESFWEIRNELLNNSIHTPQVLERLENRIVEPLQLIVDEDFDRADNDLALFRLANENGENPIAQIDQSVADMSTVIERMERVLLEMRKLETFQEAMELLKGIIDRQKEVSERTKTERKRKLIEGLKGLGFDE